MRPTPRPDSPERRPNIGFAPRPLRGQTLLTEQSVINGGVIVRCRPTQNKATWGRIITLVPLQAMFALALVSSGRSAAEAGSSTQAPTRLDGPAATGELYNGTFR